MQSQRAYILDSFVLPEGATEGTRIAFDADNGVILIYNESDQLVASIAAASGTDDDGNRYTDGFVSYGTELTKIRGALANNGRVYWTARSPAEPFDIAGYVWVTNPDTDVTDGPLMELSPPSHRPGGGIPMLRMRSESADGTTEKMRITLGARLGDSTSCTIALRGTVYGERFIGGVLVTEQWRGLPLSNGWVTDPFTGIAPRYRRAPDGRIILKGWATGGTIANGTIVATLPAGYRPDSPVMLGAACPQDSTRHISLVIRPTGAIEVYNLAVASMTFDEVGFYAADVL